MNIKKKIRNVEWLERIQVFLSGNTGRKVNIAVGGLTIVENQVLRDIDYDPLGKGNNMTLTLGYSEDLFIHIISAPTELILHEENNGAVSTLEIIDRNGEVTYLRFLN